MNRDGRPRHVTASVMFHAVIIEAISGPSVNRAISRRQVIARCRDFASGELLNTIGVSVEHLASSLVLLPL
jgi:hypothetical protein